MDSLKKSMKWDEDVYGLEYDLVSRSVRERVRGLAQAHMSVRGNCIP